MPEELRLSWNMDLDPIQVGHRIVGAWLKSASAATPIKQISQFPRSKAQRVDPLSERAVIRYCPTPSLCGSLLE